MHTISMGQERLVTSKAVADAMIGYAAALHRARDADVVTIPVVLERGGPALARVLISATAPMITFPSSTPEVELTAGPASVEDLRRRTLRLEPVPLGSDFEDSTTKLSFPDFDAYQ